MHQRSKLREGFKNKTKKSNWNFPIRGGRGSERGHFPIGKKNKKNVALKCSETSNKQIKYFFLFFFSNWRRGGVETPIGKFQLDFFKFFLKPSLSGRHGLKLRLIIVLRRVAARANFRVEKDAWVTQRQL